ncbi:Nucleotidyltransferase substrate binding protein [Caldalkalibacillus thermarum TA2.A1]|uniref:Nucleotidyltransferase substrate binding protein n=1 Tax=Caldalkalibacillus thermarum (strain TA2.A1) TaxID=986075 RepID=F5LB42_CALTT|nr:Nucleotidyltransferase substrate binding protein [Caldalkalibacillus thermarum TA2.A1]QZT35311.1 hypothetical protein HUR95_05495 [Caldalkalibacillus thermarum TA2.A1]
MLEKRFLKSQTYNEKYAEEAERLIRERYYLVLKELCEKLEVER